MRAMEAAVAVMKDHNEQFTEMLEKLKQGDPATVAAYRAALRSDDN